MEYKVNFGPTDKTDSAIDQYTQTLLSSLGGTLLFLLLSFICALSFAIIATPLMIIALLIAWSINTIL